MPKLSLHRFLLLMGGIFLLWILSLFGLKLYLLAIIWLSDESLLPASAISEISYIWQMVAPCMVSGSAMAGIVSLFVLQWPIKKILVSILGVVLVVLLLSSIQLLSSFVFLPILESISQGFAAFLPQNVAYVVVWWGLWPLLVVLLPFVYIMNKWAS